MSRKNQTIPVIQRMSGNRCSLLQGLLAAALITGSMLGTGALTLGVVSATKLSKDAAVEWVIARDQMEATMQATSAEVLFGPGERRLDGADTMVWSGTEVIFTKSGRTDRTNADKQGHTAENMWIVRSNDQDQVSSEKGGHAPNSFLTYCLADTEWAEGSAEDWQSLNFVPWVRFADRVPNDNLAGKDGVLHLIADDIYIDIEFFSWYWGERLFVQVLHAR